MKADAVASEAAGGDSRTARASYERAEQKAAEARTRIAMLKDVIAERDADKVAERARRSREHGLVQDAVRQALAGGRFQQIGRLPEELWPQAWELFQAEIAAWRTRRLAELADEAGQVPSAAAGQLKAAEELLARSIAELCAETRARRDALHAA